MKRILTLAVLLLLTSFSALAQEDIEFKEYSFAEFFQMIENEPSDVFTLKNVILNYDSLTDGRYVQKGKDQTNFSMRPQFDHTDTLRISKKLQLENILLNDYYLPRQGLFLHHLLFEKEVTFKNCIWNIYNSTFLKPVSLAFSDAISLMHLSYFGREFWPYSTINNSTFVNGIDLNTDNQNDRPINIQFHLEKCQIYPDKQYSYGYMGLNKLHIAELNENDFFGDSNLSISSQSGEDLEIRKNNFHDNEVTLLLTNTTPFPFLSIRENSFNRPVKMALGDLKQSNEIEWADFSEGIYSFFDYNNLIYEVTDSILYSTEEYFDSIRIEDRNSYRGEIALHGKLKGLYDDNHDAESANAVFITMKDIETQRLEYLYQESPSFDTYFKWKTNQFLKIFSAYGTEPSKAITFSVYVILVFGLIYLFFPNHWDSHGKNRIVDRFSFFLKYMKRDAGMHDVYLEEKQGDILAYDEYKQLLESSGKDVPKFFQATGLPLYKWAISGTKLTAGLLSRVDVMKGTWSELPQSKRVWKSVLLISAFLIALAYDILIKMLNALMLSINTFTTLGFGEIPIKGLPRYLAIIQGFIGWFMLTIFSVSLISQLLN